MVMNLHGKEVALDNPLTDISIDIETLGTDPNSIILQIGIVGFNPETGEIGTKVNTNIDLERSIKEGFSFSADTFYWWLKQDRRAGATLQENRYHPKTVCTQVEKYIQTYTVGPDDVRVWGNGAAFDNVIVKNHFQKFDIEVPWKFWNDRCARTLFALNPHISRVKPKITHVAGYDAVAQAETIIAILRENKRTVSEVSENV